MSKCIVIYMIELQQFLPGVALPGMLHRTDMLGHFLCVIDMLGHFPAINIIKTQSKLVACIALVYYMSIIWLLDVWLSHIVCVKKKGFKYN